MKKKSKTARSPCPVAATLDLVGDHWTLLIIRDMMLGKERYEDFLQSGEGIATNILAQRLRWLVENGLAERHPDPEDKRKVRYRLTELGQSLKPVLLAMIDWGLKSVDGTQFPKATAKVLKG